MPASIQRPIILLVEDSDDDAFLFHRALRLAGFVGSALHVTTGPAAIAHLDRCHRDDAMPPPDLIFLDLKISVLSGFEVLQWIRDQHFVPSPDVAVLSGSDHHGDVEQALQLGASTYYVKPILAQQLRARLNAWQSRVGRLDAVGAIDGASFPTPA